MPIPIGELSDLVVILVVAALVPLLTDALSARLRFPGVVLEIGLGIVVGPSLLGWVSDGQLVELIANLGLAMLMFLAGYEIDFLRLRGKPLNLALVGWAASVAIGIGLAMLFDIWLDMPWMYVAFAISTTAIGTLLPILRDNGEVATRLGTFLLAAGAIGEFGPIVAVSLVLQGHRPLRTVIVLLIFAAIAVLGIVLATRPRPTRVARVVGTTLATSAQFAVRVAILLLLGLVWAAEELGLDVLLGAFAGGVIFRQFVRGGPEHEHGTVESKLDGIGFGFLIPVFFVVSGVRFDAEALVSDWQTLILLPVFLLLFLACRGLPAVVLYRRVLDRRQRAALAYYTATQLPLVVVISTLGVEAGRLSTGTAAAMVGAGMLSVLIYPLIAASIRGPLPEQYRRRAAQTPAVPEL
jgi:Kef-type K+ transport system membrane component KefB